jgi:transcriptional regulator with XRE-family HTH domain
MQELFKNRLRTAISESGLLIKEVASMSGVSSRTLEGWVGKRSSLPSVLDFVLVAHVLGRPVEWFTREANDESPVTPKVAEIIANSSKLSADDLDTLCLISTALVGRGVKNNSASKAGEC